MAFADAAWWAVLVLYSKDVLGLGDAWYGVLLAAGAVGGIVGALAADRLAGRFSPVPLLIASTLAAGVPAGLIVAWPAAVLAAVLLAVSSAGFALWNVVSLSMRQRLVPAALLGRVMAVFRVVLFGGATLGSVAGGVLAARTTLAAPFIMAGALAVAAAAMLVTIIRERPEDKIAGEVRAVDEAAESG